MSDSLEFQDTLHALDHAVRTAGLEQSSWPEDDQRLADLIRITLDGDADSLLMESSYSFTAPGGERSTGGGHLRLCPVLGDRFTCWGDLLGHELGGTIRKADMEQVILNIRHWIRRGVDNMRTILPHGVPLDDLNIESGPREE